MRNAFHLVRMWDGNEWKTAFNTPTGHYKYLFMLFRLTNPPAIFQNLVNDVFQNMLDDFVFVYLDDILIFSPDEEIQTLHVCSVLQRLLQNQLFQLFIKAEKYEFHKSSVSFMGFVLTDGEIKVDPEKVSAMANWPTPKSHKGKQRFLSYAILILSEDIQELEGLCLYCGEMGHFLALCLVKGHACQ